MPTEFISFFIILLAGLFFSGIFNRLHLPWVAALIVAGVAVGPSGIDVFVPTEPIHFIGEIGLVFLMFMAGLETELTKMSGVRLKSWFIALLTSTASFFVGFSVASYFGYDVTTSLLLGIIFIPSSIAVVIPSIISNRLLSTKTGKTVVGTALITDILSLFFLSTILQTIEPITEFPLPVFYGLLIISLFVLRKVIPMMHALLRHLSNSGDEFERESRLVFTVMIGTVIIFELLGLHPTIAGFFAGFVLSDSIKSEVLKGKLHSISYGIFIPTFFIITGSMVNIDILTTGGQAVLLAGSIVASLFVTKVFTGYLSGRICGFDNKRSIFMGVALTPKLSTTLAAIFAGVEVGIVDDTLLTSVILLCVVTTIIGPIMISKMSNSVRQSEE